MSNSLEFTGGAPTTSIVNYYSSGGVNSGAVLTGGAGTNAKEELSGALTSATLKTLLTVTGGGEVPLLFAHVKDTTSRTLRVRVTVDGTVAFDGTTSAITTANHGLIVVGQISTTSLVLASPSGIRFNASLVVEVASSVTETDKVAIFYTLNKR